VSVESELFTLLTGDAGVSALVGTRVYPQVADENAMLPLVVYRRVGGAPLRNLATDDAYSSTFRLDCWATDFSGARQLATAVATAVDRYSGGTIKAVLLNEALPIRDPDTGDWRMSVGVDVVHEEV